MEATGYGVAFVTGLGCKDLLGKDVAESSVAIQGFGNVGRWTAESLALAGAKVVAVSDVYGAAYCETGFGADELAECSVSDLASKYSSIQRDELFALTVDILIPAAAGHVLRGDNYDCVKAKLIVEAANEPITKDADKELNAKGIYILPDIFANAGGVVASYAEWRQAKSGDVLECNQTFGIIEKRLGKAYDGIKQLANDLKISHRLSAHSIAVNEVSQTMVERKWVKNT